MVKYNSVISTVGNTLHNEDIARQIVAARSELRYETIRVASSFDDGLRQASTTGCVKPRRRVTSSLDDGLRQASMTGIVEA